MRYLFDEQWFEEKQDKLLRFSNSKIGRRFFRIHGKRSSVGKRKIIKIEPNAITWKKGKEFQTEFRTHNKFSKRLFHGLYPVWFLAHIWDTLIANTFQPEWNLGFDTLTVYPDAHTETSTVDGRVQHAGTDMVWSDLVNAAGSAFNDDEAEATMFSFVAGTTENRWNRIRRGIFLFDTSSIPTDNTISAAVLSLNSNAKDDSLSASPSTNIYSSTPASNTALAAGDYDSLGTTAFATAITYSAWSTSGYNDFTLNASGIAAINKDGISKFGGRNANYDVANTPPPWISGTQSYLQIFFADQTGTSSDPKLVVTYTPPPSSIKSINSLAKASVKSVNGLAIASIKNWNGLA